MTGRVLDLFCGAGGASAGYIAAGFEVVGVDINDQPNYPFDFIQANAIGWLINETAKGGFDLIHASPPCQSFSAYRRKGQGVGDGYPNLIPEVRELLQQTGLPYVIENVPGAPLQDPITLCGSSFGLDVRRHRLFETSFAVDPLPCDHAWQTPRFPPATNRTNLRRTVEVGVWRIPMDVQSKAMGIDWMTREELSQAIPPAYTEFIARQFLGLRGAA